MEAIVVRHEGQKYFPILPHLKHLFGKRMSRNSIYLVYYRSNGYHSPFEAQKETTPGSKTPRIPPPTRSKDDYHWCINRNPPPFEPGPPINSVSGYAFFLNAYLAPPDLCRPAHTGD